jgi:FlaA1/EpsC-like NDP-sugar epimerase
MSTTDFFQRKQVLVTGATGTVGDALIDWLMATDVARVCAVDNNETALYAMEVRHARDPRFHGFVGDIRDAEKVRQLTRGIDIVFHGAALKHVTVCEKSPFDAVQTNIIGLQNLITAAGAHGVQRVVLMSSDKAVNPSNVMGASKLMGERLMTAANNRESGTVFTSVRFGNVLGSRGSVLPLFVNQIRRGGPVTVTDESMTRFVMSPLQAVTLVVEAARLAFGGEVFVTKMPAVRIPELAQVVVDLQAPVFGYRPADIAVEQVGIRPGEKIYEELLSEEEIRRTVELQHYFVVLPAFRSVYRQIDYAFEDVVRPVVEKVYRSDKEECLPPAEISDFLRREKLLPVPAGQASI